MFNLFLEIRSSVDIHRLCCHWIFMCRWYEMLSAFCIFHRYTNAQLFYLQNVYICAAVCQWLCSALLCLFAIYDMAGTPALLWTYKKSIDINTITQIKGENVFQQYFFRFLLLRFFFLFFFLAFFGIAVVRCANSVEHSVASSSSYWTVRSRTMVVKAVILRHFFWLLMCMCLLLSYR